MDQKPARTIRQIIGDEDADAVLAYAAKRVRQARRRRARVLPTGTISSGTLRMEDLIPRLASALAGIVLTPGERAIVREADPWSGRIEEVEADVLYNELNAIAENHCPPYCYFGSTEGDGAEIGVWPAWDAIDEAGMGRHPEIVRSRKDVSAREIARVEHPTAEYALEVTDHGNATLYRKAGRRWVEVWAVV